MGECGEREGEGEGELGADFTFLWPPRFPVHRPLEKSRFQVDSRSARDTLLLMMVKS